MKSNIKIQNEILDAIKKIELLGNDCIGVYVKDGHVILTGTVDNYLKKIEAVDAARNIDGVESVLDIIEIQYGSLPKITDEVISFIVINAINWNWEITNLKISVEVINGEVTLTGEVQWNFQREAVESRILNLAGVRCVFNNIQIIRSINEISDNTDSSNSQEPNCDCDIDYKRLHKDNDKIYILDAAGRLYKKSSRSKGDINHMQMHNAGLN